MPHGIRADIRPGQGKNNAEIPGEEPEACKSDEDHGRSIAGNDTFFVHKTILCFSMVQKKI